MEAERWRQIDELLEAALEIDAGRRAAFLHEACAGDEGLFREVEELVKAHAQASDFIEAPALQDARLSLRTRRAASQTSGDNRSTAGSPSRLLISSQNRFGTSPIRAMANNSLSRAARRRAT